MASAATTIKPKVSAGHDESKVTDAASRLVSAGRWRMTEDEKGLEKVFQFKTFKATWDFMNSVAGECKKQKHHPEWTNIYNKTQIRWTTHNPSGLSSKDVTMAEYCDQVAKDHGVQDPDVDSMSQQEGSKLEAGDCCKPKSQ